MQEPAGIRATHGVSTILLPELKATLSDPQTVREIFEELHPADSAELVAALESEDAQLVLRALPAPRLAPVLAALDPALRARAIAAMPEDKAGDILEQMAPDDRAGSLAGLEQTLRNALLARLSPEARSAAELRLRHARATAGRLMTDRFQTIPDTARAAEALEITRQGAHLGRSAAAVFVVDKNGVFRGRLLLRQILAAPPGTPVVEIMDPPIAVDEHTDQEQVARIIAKYDLLAAPVVDHVGKLLGIVTVDDIVDVLIDETTEDVQRMGGLQPLEMPYFAAGFWLVARKRATWLLALFLSEFFTGTALRHYSTALEHALTLVFFVPLIVSSGGNAGSQSATLITRGLAVGEIKPRHFLRVGMRELGMGLALGLFLGAIGYTRALMWGNGPVIALVVALTLVAVVTAGALTGGLLPLVFKRLGLDPAITSSPFVASLVDVTGIVCYFSIARLLLHVH